MTLLIKPSSRHSEDLTLRNPQKRHGTYTSMKSLTAFRITVISLLIFVAPYCYAEVQNIYNFTSPIEQQRFQHLISELRCLICQNQSLAESNAPLALDLKREVYEKVVAGISEEEIKHYLVLRYGEYILFKPMLNNVTFILWLGPLVFLLGALFIMSLSIRRNNKS
jgi:cytochrome c-type biogenesis protein CcmH